MTIREITSFLESIAPPFLQEQYDNIGLLTGNGDQECTGAMICLDVTEAVIEEAVKCECNLIVSHHPIIFKGLKRLTGSDYVEKAVIAAIRNEIALFAIHTNLDNTGSGVSAEMASRMGLLNSSVLEEKTGMLRKLFTFVPVEDAQKVKQALFEAGAGHIGNYDSCSFQVEGEGSFRGLAGTDPYLGIPGELTRAREVKIETVYPAHLESGVLEALRKAHPYEEIAYDIVTLSNAWPQAGSGIIGELSAPLEGAAFLARLKDVFGTPVIRHSPLLNKPVIKVAICGGAGSFLRMKALRAGADAFVTADLKYHEFFDANDRMLLADIGHFESERFTIDLLERLLRQKFPTFAVLKTSVVTNPVRYFPAGSTGTKD